MHAVGYSLLHGNVVPRSQSLTVTLPNIVSNNRHERQCVNVVTAGRGSVCYLTLLHFRDTGYS